MKVKELIEALSKVDPELEVCTFSDSWHGPDVVDSVAIYFGVHQTSSIKAAKMRDTGSYVGLGLPGDFDYRIPPNMIEDLY